jgi:hypothetical protein
MEIKIGEVVRKEGTPIEVKVSFWDDTRPEPQDVAEVTVHLRTDETNVFILKTEALMKAQELIVHVAGISMGKGDELLNDFILMQESLKGGVAGLRPPVSWPAPATRYELPAHLLAWREGDEITEEHRRAMADALIQTFNLPPHKAEKEYEKVKSVPASLIADALAVRIAAESDMDEATFQRTFPTISKSKSLVVTAFLVQLRKSPGSNEEL